MIKDFGVEKVKIEGKYEHQILRHLTEHISYEERRELFQEARRDGNAHFTYRVGGEYRHAILKRNSSGTYTIEEK